MLGDERYRIMSIDSQGIKVISTEGVINQSFDNSGARNNSDNTFCTSSAGCNIWTKVIDTIQNGVSSDTILNGSGYTGTVTTDSTAFTYLHETYYKNYLMEVDEYIVKDALWNVGTIARNTGGMPLESVKTQEEQWLWQGKIVLMNATDYVQAQLPENENSISCLNNIYSNTACKVNNWLHFPDVYTWMINPRTSKRDILWFQFTDGRVGTVDVNQAGDYHPVIYLNSDVVMSGTGVIGDEYKIVSK